MFLNITHESLNEFVIRYIYNDKKSKSFDGMQAAKWKKMKSRKSKSFLRLGLDADSNIEYLFFLTL